MTDLKEMLIHSLGGFTAEEYADALQKVPNQDAITRVFKQTIDPEENTSKIFIPADELWKCDTCFYHRNGKCSTWCDSVESYRPAWTELTKYTIKKDQVVKAAYWKVSFHGQGKPYRYHCTLCDEDMTKDGNLIASKFCPDCGAMMDLHRLSNTTF